MDKAPVSVIGLGKLGTPAVAAFASKGHRVIGVDTDPRSVAKTVEGTPPVSEAGLGDLFAAHRDRITATLDVERAVLDSEITFIIVPTPSDAQGGFKLDFVLAAADRVGAALRHKTRRHLVALSSTVLPGSMRDRVAPALEASSGKAVGRDFGLCYNPMFIALGSVVRDILNPDFVLIGESDPAAGERLAAFYAEVCDNRPPVSRMNWFNAELSKVAVNSFVTMKISFANTLAEVCEQVPEADVAAVTRTLGLDRRIGAPYLKGALGFGGPCFPRDNAAFTVMARRLGVDPLLADATDRINLRQQERLERKVRALLPVGGAVAVLGLAYKPDTPVIDASQALELARALLAAGIDVHLYDPMGGENARRSLGGKGMWAASARACVERADVVVIANPCEEFKRLTAEDLTAGGRRRVVVDCWRVLDAVRLDGRVRVVGLGLGSG